MQFQLAAVEKNLNEVCTGVKYFQIKDEMKGGINVALRYRKAGPDDHSLSARCCI